MNNPKHNFTIIPNWLVDELSGAELKLYCKMYNCWCLYEKKGNGSYYRPLSKLKEDMGMSPNSNEHRLLERIKKFEELGILTVERSNKKVNRYKFNEDFMFNHDEDVLHETCSSDIHKTCSNLLHETCSSLLHKTCRHNNTIIKDKKENTVQYNTCTIVNEEKEINKEKESNTAGQGSLSEEGFSDFNLTNEGNNFIQSEGERDRQGINETVSLSSKDSGENNELNIVNDMKDSQNTGLHSNLHQAIAPFRGESDSEPPQSSARPPLTDTPKRSYGDVYWQVRKMIEKGKGFSEQKVRDYVHEHFIITGEVPQHEFEADLSELQRLKESLEEKKGYTTEGDLVSALTSEPFVPYGVTAEA